MCFGDPHPFSERGHLQDWARQDKQVQKGGQVDH